MKDYRKLLATNIKKLRQKNNITIKELSAKTNIRESFLLKLENQKAKRILLSHIDNLCKYFNVNVKELFE